MTRTQNEKFILIFEAAKRSLLAYDKLHGRLWRHLRAMEPLTKESRPVDELAEEAFVDAVALVDFAHRFGQLVDALPLLNKKEPAPRLLQDALCKVEIARHYLQHMRNDLQSPDPITYPLLGSIAWANEPESFLVTFSQATPASQHGLVFDTHALRYVNALEYTVAETSVDLDLVKQRMHAAYQWIVSKVSFAPPETANLEWGKSIAACFTFKAQPRNSAPDALQAPDRADLR